MAEDFTQPQEAGGEAYERARSRSLQQRRAPGQVPGYQMLRCLGQGAYGEVWLGTQQTNPAHRVAVKFYTRHGGDWSSLAREVEKLNILTTDRYIVQLLDVGWTANPPYCVMEYLENGSLAQRLEAGPLAVAEAVVLFREITEGVVSAHNRGVLHCDLKPANVLLGPDGKPRLADFGQARLAGEHAASLGTLFYMAPEQTAPESAPDARWDVYALGALLYCLLTGEPPYRDAPGAESVDESPRLEERLSRYRKVLETAPRPRGHRRRAGTDRALVEIINRCLAIRPEKRYPNAQAVLYALDARARSRARRPLLVLGAVGPVLLLGLMALQIRANLLTAVQQSSEALIDDERVSNEFAAQAMAGKVAGKIDRRWRTLEYEAGDPQLQRRLRAARQKALGTPEQRDLQDWLASRQQAHPDLPAELWAVFDDAGTMLAFSPRNPELERRFIGRNYADRDFFNGLASDRKDPPFPTPPLTRVHRSKIFHTQLSDARKVAFSVPVWDGGRAPGAPRLGVLAMAVEVGGFMEVRSGDHLSKDQLAILIDLRPDQEGRRGAILDHPYLARLRQEHAPAERLAFFVDPQQFDRGTWDPDARDPVADVCADYAGRWLAASAPVQLDEPEQGGDTGWVVVVEKRHDTAIGPVQRLQTSMLARGGLTLAIAIVVVTGLWGFVIVVLNESPGSRLVAWLRRRAGLGVERPTLTGGTGVPPSAPRRSTPAGS
jgi:serine/threonine protein kinase